MELGASFWTIAHPLSCVPSLHGRYPPHRYYGRSDSRRAALRPLSVMNTAGPRRVSLITALNCPTILSPTLARRAGITRLPTDLTPPRQASPLARRLAHPRRPNRVHRGFPCGKPLLRTGRSRSFALYLVLPRRSYGSIPHDALTHGSRLFSALAQCPLWRTSGRSPTGNGCTSSPPPVGLRWN